MTFGVAGFARYAGIAALFVLAALLGTLSGVLFAYSGDLPQISALDQYAPNTITRVLGKDGQLVGDFAVERRVLVRYDEVPVVLREAVLAAEDSSFFHHLGVNPQRVLIAGVSNLLKMRKAGGASTLTQQLARKLFLTDEKTWERKVKELLLTVQIEKRYTKEEIFAFYCNQMYFGHGAYGVAAASELYFGKPLKDLTVDEAALIAGILQGNARQSPYVNMEAALRRRNYTLDRMADEGFISRADATAAIARPIVTRGAPGQASNTTAPYFLEEVRKYIENTYGAKALYENGLTVHTALDLRLQQIANHAVDRGLRRLDKRRGFRRVAKNVLAGAVTVTTYQNDRWTRPIVVGDIVPALVTSVGPATAHLRIGRLSAELDKTGFQWTRRTAIADVVKVGDLIDVEITALDDATKAAKVTLEQTPVVEGALVAIDNHSGEILAMVGGYSFNRSKFNRATQAYRQMGSTIKPFLYTAAIDRGLTPTMILVDEPTTFNAGEGQPPYQPGNYDGKFEGPITLRRAVEDSRNIPAVKVIQMLGPVQVAAYAKRFGFSLEFRPFLSMALGAQEATLLETTSAFSAFANHGIRMEPFYAHKITDREGSLLEERRPQPRDAIRADTAYVINSLLQGVIERGTGTPAKVLKWPLAGKTGTVDEFTDAWFVGFDPNITVGVWIGHDEKKPLGPGEQGARAALPTWIEFMKGYIDLYGNRENPPSFDAPGNIVFVPVDEKTGDFANEGTTHVINEVFISGTQPVRQ
jgi:penicillin-binding protein 1A